MKSFLDVEHLSQNIQNISFPPLHVDDTPWVAWPIKIYFLSRLLLCFFDHWSTSCFAWTLTGFIVLSLTLYNFLFWPPQNIYRTPPGNSPVCFGSCPKYHVCMLSPDSFLSRVSLIIFGVNTGPLVRSMNFHASNYFNPMVFFREPMISDRNTEGCIGFISIIFFLVLIISKLILLCILWVDAWILL